MKHQSIEDHRGHRALTALSDEELDRLTTIFSDPKLCDELMAGTCRWSEAFAAYLLGCAYLDVRSGELYEKFRRDYRPRLRTLARVDAHVLAVTGRDRRSSDAARDGDGRSLRPSGQDGEARRPGPQFSVVMTDQRMFFFERSS